MGRMTIDYGIDLGTTNSSIAVLKGSEAEIIKNNEGFECTPSAVWIDKGNRLIVGRRAKERFFDDEENAACEFKLQMGTAEERLFRRSGRRMKPEELSAEVLKQLKADVRQRYGEDVQAAVITVPAAFELPQCKATEKAAQLAGLLASPLLQEPIAAALAYGFQSADDQVFWMVYDFGGGTFDAAVIQMRDGVCQVVNHGGDNHLGGKLIDWEIVEQLLVPVVTCQYKLSDFRHGSPRWIAAFAKLKLAAEEAKIRVSRDESTEIIIDYLCNDDNGQPVRLEYELKRADVERLAEPFVVRSINICKKALAEKRLEIQNVQKVLLVGGPTLMPYLRERLADKKHGLGVPLDYSIDPLTVVARGAAIFAGTRRMPTGSTAPATAQQYAVQLDYQPVGPDSEPVVGGRVSADKGKPLAGFTIEFVNATARTPWRSGKLPLAPSGAFVTSLWAEKGVHNTFLIELCDPVGSKCLTVPDRFPYTIGLGMGDPILIRSLGIALANNETMVFLAKGTPLPARRRGETLRTAVNVLRGQQGYILKIPVVEGEHIRRADRNRLVGILEIRSDGIKRDLPAGSEIEITIEIDESRLVRTKAYVPLLDEEFESVVKLIKDMPDLDQLRRDFRLETHRLAEARKKADEFREEQAMAIIRRIDAERMEHDVEAALAAAETDRDAAYRCQDRLLDLRSAIDQLEDLLEWPALVAEANKELDIERRMMSEPAFDVTPEERMNYRMLCQQIEDAKQNRDAELLQAKVEEMDGLGRMILWRQPGWWAGILEHMAEKKATMSSQAEAEQQIAAGRRAIHNNDFPALKKAVRKLAQLLPPADPDRTNYGSGLIR